MISPHNTLSYSKQWLVGYLSGVAAGLDKDLLTGMNNDSILMDGQLLPCKPSQNDLTRGVIRSRWKSSARRSCERFLRKSGKLGRQNGTVKLTAKVRKCPGRMGNISRLRVLSSFGTLVQRESKAVTRHQSGGYWNARSLT